jgi:aryl-alcohol dehydrogenase-like predicted oxidoreductase
MKKENESPLNESRRSFLKTATLASVAISTAPLLNTVSSANRTINGEDSSNTSEKMNLPVVKSRRILGMGEFAMEVSAVGFGCMGLNYHRSQHPVEKAAVRLLHEAIERGVTLFDTAESYGSYTNEELVGKALKGYTDRVFVSTKFSFNYGGKAQNVTDNIRRACENSLRRLGIEAIGIYYQHRPHPDTPVESVADAMRSLIKEGKILHWGLCEVNADTIRKAHAICPPTAIQSEYHLMYRQPEQSVLPVCEELGIGFVPYSPINRAFLSGAINEYTRFDPKNDNRPDSPRFQPEAIRANTRIVEVLNAFGRTRGITPAQIALAWLMNRYPWIVPIPGTTKLSHLEENLRASDIHLSADEMQELEKAVEAVPVVGNRYSAEQEARSQK